MWHIYTVVFVLSDLKIVSWYAVIKYKYGFEQNLDDLNNFSFKRAFTLPHYRFECPTSGSQRNKSPPPAGHEYWLNLQNLEFMSVSNRNRKIAKWFAFASTQAKLRQNYIGAICTTELYDEFYSYVYLRQLPLSFFSTIILLQVCFLNQITEGKLC